MRHYITKYHEDGKQKVVSWVQINLFGKSFCFFKKEITI